LYFYSRTKKKQENEEEDIIQKFNTSVKGISEFFARRVSKPRTLNNDMKIN
jgi:hypothetical protein